MSEKQQFSPLPIKEHQALTILNELNGCSSLTLKREMLNRHNELYFAVYTTLPDLEEKGYVTSEERPRENPKYKSKELWYFITNKGKEAIALPVKPQNLGIKLLNTVAGAMPDMVVLGVSILTYYKFEIGAFNFLAYFCAVSMIILQSINYIDALSKYALIDDTEKIVVENKWVYLSAQLVYGIAFVFYALSSSGMAILTAIILFLNYKIREITKGRALEAEAL